MFWIILSQYWSDWQESLVIVKPDTAIRWHKKGFRLFWRWESRAKSPGRPRTNREIRELIYQMAMDNPLWGAPRIHGELWMLGFTISERTVSRLMPKRPRKPSSQTWRAFIRNHVTNMVSIDFFTVPTATFHVLFVLVVMKHYRRRLVHFNVIKHPSAEWTAQQIVEAFPWETAPKYLIRDRDGIYGAYFQKRVENMGIEQVLTAPKSPWQNAYAERLIGSIRRECLDHVIVLNDKHLRRILSSYFECYNKDRTHYSLEKGVPFDRPIRGRPNQKAKIMKFPKVGGLHHRYEWQKAA